MITSSNNPAFSARAIKRVLRDLAELQAQPISGISLVMPDINSPFVLHGNIKIQDGIYEGILIHLVVHIPDEYPIKPPAVNIAPGINFGQEYHAHIFDDPTHGNSICTDLTSNFAGHFQVIDASGKPAKSGWTPAYTLSSVLVQLQVFFADPDTGKDALPSEAKIEKLRKHIKGFELDIRVNDGSDETTVVTHSFEHPYPPLSCGVQKVETKVNEKEEVKEIETVKSVEVTPSKGTLKGENLSTNSQGSAHSQSSTVSTQNRQSPIVEDEIFEEVKENSVSNEKSTPQKIKTVVTCEWGKSLAKVAKSDKANGSKKSSSAVTHNNNNTQVVRVVKERQHKDDPQDLMSKALDNMFPKKSSNWRGPNSNARRNTGYGYSQQTTANSGTHFNYNRDSNGRSTNNYRGNNNRANTNGQSSTYRNGGTHTQYSATSRAPRDAKTLEVVEEFKIQAEDPHPSASGNAGEWGSSSLKKVTPNSNEPRKLGINGRAANNETILKEGSIFVQNDVYPESSATKSQIKKEVLSKLLCSVSKADIFDDSKPILGYPIDIEKDQYGRLWPIPIMEILSYDSFVFNIQQNHHKLDNYARVKFTSSFGSSYNYWLPIYINDEHFERSKQHIFNAIAIIYAGVEGKKENDFRPEMVLKVLPQLLTKTAIHFLKGSIHQSIAGIDAYCHLYQLFVKMIKVFPELQVAIDKEIRDFCTKESYRHKRVAGELGDFMIKLSLSSNGLNNIEARHIVFKERITRQISWVIRKDRGLFYNTTSESFVRRFMNASQVSNQFSLVEMEVARLLVDENVKKQLENQCGVLNEETVKIFRGRMSWIQKYIVEDWKTLVQGLELDHVIQSEEALRKEIIQSFSDAKAKGYLEY